MFRGMDVVTGNQIASWQNDPRYKTQVSYNLKTPKCLVVRPAYRTRNESSRGRFSSFRSYFIVHDSTERERQGLTLRRHAPSHRGRPKIRS
jgi:hypothetical protein